MAYSDTGSVPETLPRDASVRPEGSAPIEDDPSRELDRPEADPSMEEILRDAREAARENGTGTPGKIDEAIAASEAEVGAAATRDRLLNGELTAADGTVLLDGLSQDQRVELAESYESGIRERADGPDVELTSEMTDLKNFEETGIQPLLADNFQDPEAAMEQLKSLDEQEINALRQGDASVLGDTAEGASLDKNESRALSAFADAWDQSPEAAALITESQDQDHARALEADLDGREPGSDSPRRGTDPEPYKGSADPAFERTNKMETYANRTEHLLAHAASSPQMI